ncbi:hypothetical protein QL285_035738 [Trifolium repens]|nr:hypothetical protein QL285_035738 [Trifolium repens]
MQVYWLPKSVYDDLDKSVRRLIWKGTCDTRMHWVSWSKITQPRKFGGLGVRCSRSQNTALLGKLIWELLQAPDKLWVSLFNDRYLKGQLPFNCGSVIWNVVAKAMQILKEGFTLEIGDGESSFWHDSLALKERLCSVVPVVAIQDTTMKINDVWLNGGWNFQTLYIHLPDNIVTAIEALHPRFVPNLPDVWTWSNATSGVYSVKDSYNWLLKPAPLQEHANWQWIWQFQVPANIQFFVWQIIHGLIPVRVVLHHRHVCNTDVCPRCTNASESIEHCLFYRPTSIHIWRACGIHSLPPQGTDTFT